MNKEMKDMDTSGEKKGGKDWEWDENKKEGYFNVLIGNFCFLASVK